MIVALVALGVALGGTAYAVNTVGSEDVIDNSLRTEDLRNNAAVRSIDVQNNSLTPSDLKPGTGDGIMLGQITDMLDSSIPANAPAVGKTIGSGTDLPGGMPVPLDIEVSNLTVHAPLFTTGDTVTFALATNAGPTAVSCVATVEDGNCDSGTATAVIPAGSEISLRYQAGVPAAARNFVAFGWRYRTLP
jgi:hypothetical protein